MSATPAFHAVIELQNASAGGWFYGYDVRLKESFSRCPMPGADSATTQKGEAVKEVALLFALYDICKRAPYPFADDLDEQAIRAALVEEAGRLLEETAQTVFTKYYKSVLDNERLRFQLSHVLPPKFRTYLNLEALTNFTMEANNNSQPAQLSLF